MPLNDITKLILSVIHSCYILCFISISKFKYYIYDFLNKEKNITYSIKSVRNNTAFRKAFLLHMFVKMNIIHI